jgi:zinc transport system substrate-binding protein
MHKKYLTLVALSFGIMIIVIISLTAKPLGFSDKPTVAASIFPIYDIAQNVAGDEVDVKLVLPAGSSPHTFAPSPSDIIKLQRADGIYTIGAGLDDWSSIITESLNIEAVPLAPSVLTVQEGIGAIDPHYWLSIENGKLIASAVLADLSERYPESIEAFTENHNSYIVELEDAQKEIAILLQDIPSRNILTFHNSFAYFAAENDLNIVGSFEPTAGREPTPQELVQLTQLIEELDVTVIYTEPQLSTAPLQAFLNDNNIEVKVLDPIGGSENTESYISLMLQNARVISQNQ